VNIGGDYESGRSVRQCMWLCTRRLDRNGGALLWKLLGGRHWRRYALSRAPSSLINESTKLYSIPGLNNTVSNEFITLSVYFVSSECAFLNKASCKAVL